MLFAAGTALGGDWAFESFDAGLPKTGQWRNGFDVADMNGDGHLDIVHGPPRKGDRTPVVFLGDSRGNWTRWSEAQFPAMSYDYGDAAAMDFDGDGNMDVALGMHMTGVAALFGDGTGQFADMSEGLPRAEADGGFSSRALESADWDGDGRPELLALGEGPMRPGATQGNARGLRVYDYSAETGSWDLILDGAAPEAVFGDAVAVADFDGDGRVDALASSSALSSRNVLWMNSVDGSTAAEFPGLPEKAYIHAVAAAAGNDGAMAAVSVQSWDGEEVATSIELLAVDSKGGWARRTVFRESEGPPVTSLALGDVDADGEIDIVSGDKLGRVRWFPASSGPPVTVSDEEMQCYCIRLADLDGDSTLDIVAGFAGDPSPLSGFGQRAGGGLRVWRIRGVDIELSGVEDAGGGHSKE